MMLTTLPGLSRYRLKLYSIDKLFQLLHAGVISESAVPLVLPKSLPLINFFYIFISGEFRYAIHQLFWVSVSAAVLFHELGHALCAVAEKAPLINVGILSLLCFPGAFGKLDCIHQFINCLIVKMDLSGLPTWPKIRVFSAGVWHNLVLSTICYFLLENRDVMLKPFYSTHQGFVVLDISPYSSIGGEFGIKNGDILSKVNDCDLTSKSFETCINQLHGSAQLGFCGEEIIDTFDCCPGENATHICFESGQNRGCKRARSIVESSSSFCFKNGDCSSGHCLTPVVNETIKERLLVIHSGADRVLYLGVPNELLHSMILINYVPRFWPVPITAPQVLLKPGSIPYFDFQVQVDKKRPQ